jgi:hypothetical protein
MNWTSVRYLKPCFCNRTLLKLFFIVNKENCLFHLQFPAGNMVLEAERAVHRGPGTWGKDLPLSCRNGDHSYRSISLAFVLSFL